MPADGAVADSPRLGRALFFVHQQLPHCAVLVVRAKLGTLAVAGQAMDFAVRLKDHRERLDPKVAHHFATQAGLDARTLLRDVLPVLKQADLIDFDPSPDATGIARIQEFVGLSGRIIDQALKVVAKFGPSDVEMAVLHSVEIASWAPLTAAQHAEQIASRGFDDKTVEEAVGLALAAGVNQRVHAPALGEWVIYNPNVWGAESVGVAGFLKTLGPGERDSLLGMCEQAADKPGLALPRYEGFSTPVLNSARKVGLLQAATVRSSVGGAAPQTYVFSPMQESEDDQLQTTEALHQRKMFLAHILYGHERAMAGRGRILDPRILVDRLVSRGSVGPATNIGTDYHLLEAQGIVSVRPGEGGRAYLDAVKMDVIEGGLGWLRQSFDLGGGVGADPGQLLTPNAWNSPEQDRMAIGDQGAAAEITTAAVLRLREAKQEAQRAARHDF